MLRALQWDHDFNRRLCRLGDRHVTVTAEGEHRTGHQSRTDGRKRPSPSPHENFVVVVHGAMALPFPGGGGQKITTKCFFTMSLQCKQRTLTLTLSSVNPQLFWTTALQSFLVLFEVSGLCCFIPYALLIFFSCTTEWCARKERHRWTVALPPAHDMIAHGNLINTKDPPSVLCFGLQKFYPHWFPTSFVRSWLALWFKL